MLSRPLLTALIAGLVSATGFAPLNLWPITLVALRDPALAESTSAPTLKAVLLRGWVFGVGHFTVGNNWIQHAFDYQDKMPPALGYFAVVLVALLSRNLSGVRDGARLALQPVGQAARWRTPRPISRFVLAAAALPGSSPNICAA